jgi:hypothetical protein
MGRFSSSVLTAGSIPANVNALIATTLPKVQADIVDNFFEATPFFWWMREKNRTMTYDGGDSMEMPVMFDENPYAKAYEPYEVMDVAPPQGIATTWWRIAHYRVPIMYSRNTAVANRGESAVVNLITALKEQAQLSLVKAVNTDLFSETAATNTTKEINSMYTIIEEAAQASQDNVPGGISKSTYDWWRNQYKAITDTATGIVSAIRELHMNCSNGADTPDLGLCDDYTYINLEDKLSTNVRFVNPRAVEFGFENLTYKGMTIMFDKSIDDDSHNGNGDGSLFLCNTNYLKLVIGSDADFRVLAPEYDKYQDAYVGAILADLQLTCSNCKRQGVLNGGAFADAC